MSRDRSTSTRAPARASMPALLAVGAFGLLSLLGGWLVVVGGGFHAATAKFSANTVFVDGLPALLMALLEFLAAALAFTWLLRQRWTPLAAGTLATVLVFAPPALFLWRGPLAG